MSGEYYSSWAMLIESHADVAGQGSFFGFRSLFRAARLQGRQLFLRVVDLPLQMF